MKITSINFNTRYIRDLPTSMWPTTCDVTISGDDADKSWQRVEQTLTPEQTQKVCEYIGNMLLVKPEIDLRYYQPTDADIAEYVAKEEAKKLAAERLERLAAEDEYEVAMSDAEGEAWADTLKADEA